MEVILKRTKITRSIMNQIVWASVSELKTFDVLGTCIYDGRSYIVLYSDTMLRVYPLYKEIVHDDNAVKLIFGGRYVAIHFTTSSLKESIELSNFFKELKQIALEKGQFFL